jgi:hypothetical protein
MEDRGICISCRGQGRRNYICTDCRDPDYGYDGIIGVCNQVGYSRLGHLGGHCDCDESALYIYTVTNREDQQIIEPK